MTAPDDLSALGEKPFADAVVKFEELLSQSGRAFLIGAGCSKCAGLPLTAELTQEALGSNALDNTTKVTNESDREHVKAILPDSMAGLTKMLSGLRRQEAIFVGQAAMLPSRILIRDLLPEQLPKSNDIDFDKGWQSAAMSEEQLKVVANRWRYQKR